MGNCPDRPGQNEIVGLLLRRTQIGDAATGIVHGRVREDDVSASGTPARDAYPQDHHE
jgi:hypothetical protein